VTARSALFRAVSFFTAIPALWMIDSAAPSKELAVLSWGPPHAGSSEPCDREALPAARDMSLGRSFATPPLSSPTRPSSRTRPPARLPGGRRVPKKEAYSPVVVKSFIFVSLLFLENWTPAGARIHSYPSEGARVRSCVRRRAGFEVRAMRRGFRRGRQHDGAREFKAILI
jgi:hypothetical protein